jgi:aminoglycoside phosphotransferase (APT) family kinase protein
LGSEATTGTRGRMMIGGLSPLVLTHGEPHAANTIKTDSGLVLIDWDSALIAPRERDLWSLALEDPAILHHYASKAGVTHCRTYSSCTGCVGIWPRSRSTSQSSAGPTATQPVRALHGMASATP